MSSRKNESQLFQNSRIKGKKGTYEIRSWMNERNKRQFSSTPGYTPTTISPRLLKARPQIYKANLLKKNHKTKNSKLVAIKVVDISNINKLKIEYEALKRVQNTISPIAPKLIEGITYLQEEKLAFFSYEWLDEGEWVTLEKILQENKPIYKRDTLNKNEEFTLLYQTLFRVIKRVHQCGVIHGDLKPEHILVRNRNDELNYGDIRLIDFGLSYTEQTSLWRGGTNGFTNPIYWNDYENEVLSWNELTAVDFYGVRAMLFYVFTGEVYPATSPAFRYITQPGKTPTIKNYYEKLNDTIRNRFLIGDPPSEFFNILERLGQPDNFNEQKVKADKFAGLLKLRENMMLIFAWFYLFVGLISTLEFSIETKVSLIIGSVFILIGINYLSINERYRQIIDSLLVFGISYFLIKFLTPIYLFGWITAVIGILIGCLVSLMIIFINKDWLKKWGLIFIVGGVFPMIIPRELLFVTPLFFAIVFKEESGLIKYFLILAVSLYTWLYHNIFGCTATIETCLFFASPIYILIQSIAWTAALRSYDYINSKDPRKYIPILTTFIPVMILSIYPLIANLIINIYSPYTIISFSKISLLGFALMLGWLLIEILDVIREDSLEEGNEIRYFV